MATNGTNLTDLAETASRAGDAYRRACARTERAEREVACGGNVSQAALDGYARREQRALVKYQAALAARDRVAQSVAVSDYHVCSTCGVTFAAFVGPRRSRLCGTCTDVARLAAAA